MTWDVTKPAGTDNISNGDNIIREFKTDIQTALVANDATLGDEGVFPVSTTVPQYRYRGLKGTTAQRPTAGNYGLYFNTTTNQIERDSGVAWESVGGAFPPGTEMLFYQSSAPLGWTRSVAINDRIVRIVSAGAPGTTGGTWAAMAGTTGSSGDHSHTVNSHTHDEGTYTADICIDETEHTLKSRQNGTNFTANTHTYGLDNTGTQTQATDSVLVSGDSGAATPGTNTTGAHTHSFTTTHGSTQHAYADFLLAVKD